MFRHEGGSGRLDQANRLRRMMTVPEATAPPDHPAAHVIAVVSGKGGVGKTFISANLAIALSARGHRVVLFDLDMGLANTDIILGVEAAGTWPEVLGGRRSPGEVIIQGPGDIAFVPGASGMANIANLSEFERHQLLAVLEEIESRYDVCVLDCGAGISRNVVTLAASADTLLVVTTPEPTAVTDAYATIKAFAQERQCADTGMGGSMGVIVNQALSRREGRDTYERLASVAARFLHVPVTDYGYILADEHVPAAVRQRRPVLLDYPRCAASSCVMAMAGRLSRELGRPEARQSLFYRVISLFI
ncbi:MAG TPA: MinD/ParA family protein [Phycisphaerae bacterium]|nr:MinD/ParA family protein [Phycisphaerae bacterium]HRY69747.1 MinD/ParA family protein [Phycisphaerae bacterium]HSA29387.1 MinD/ParA family protein [Phycisphaerae bacterium]